MPNLRSQMYNKLRQPDFSRHRNQGSLSRLLSKGELDICRPFPPWSLPEVPTWTEDPYGDDTWGLYYHSLGWLITLDYGIDQASEVETQEVCAARLRRLLFSYLEHLDSKSDSDFQKMTWFDHATAWRGSTIAYLYERRFKGRVSASEARLFERVAKLHVDRLLAYIDSGRWNANNHGIFHAEALWDISQVFGPEPFPQDIANIALHHMRRVFSSMIDFEEGVCREQSIYYHLFDASLLADSSRYMDAFGIEVVPGYPAVLRAMLDFYSAFHPDGEFLQPVGDTQFGKGADTALLRNIARSAAPADVNVAQEDFGLTTYPSNGYYLFRSPGDNSGVNSFAVLLDKPYLGAHGHADGGSFLLNRNGEPFLVDSGGPYAYGKKLRFNYFKAAEAHNVAIFGERSEPYLTRVTAPPTQSVLGNSVRLETVDMKVGTWSRTVVALRGGVFLLLDQLSQAEEDLIDVLFHLAPGIQVRRLSSSTLAMESTSSTLTMEQVSDAKFEIRENGGESEFPRGLVTRQLGGIDSAPVLSTRVKSKKCWILTILGGEPGVAQVHTLFGGKLIRVLLPGAQSIGVDCNLEDKTVAPRIYTFRTHR